MYQVIKKQILARNTRENKGGFTLIELLVVVLIIGILAAVALPQYQKAVEKARMTEAIIAVEAIAKANDLYYLTHGNYTNNINDLMVYDNLPDTDYFGIVGKQSQNFLLAASNCIGPQKYKALVQRPPVGTKYSLAIHFGGKKECDSYSNSSEYERQLCQAWARGL